MFYIIFTNLKFFTMKNVFALFACSVLSATAFASNDGIERPESTSPKSGLKPKELLKIFDDLAFDCHYHIGVFDQDKNYVTGKTFRGWVDSEQDCTDQKNEQIASYIAQYPSTYNVYDTEDKGDKE